MVPRQSPYFTFFDTVGGSDKRIVPWNEQPIYTDDFIGRVAWHGTAWRGVAWRGVAWRGVAWRGVAWRGVAWRGVAWRGVAMALRNVVCTRCVGRGVRVVVCCTLPFFFVKPTK